MPSRKTRSPQERQAEVADTLRAARLAERNARFEEADRLKRRAARLQRAAQRSAQIKDRRRRTEQARLYHRAAFDVQQANFRKRLRKAHLDDLWGMIATLEREAREATAKGDAATAARRQAMANTLRAGGASGGQPSIGKGETG